MTLKQNKIGESKMKNKPFNKMTDNELVDLLIEEELQEMTSTGDIAIMDAPEDVEDLESDMEGDEMEAEDITLEEAKKLLGLVLEEAYKMEDFDYPSFERTVQIIRSSFGKSIPNKYLKVLESEYSEKTKNILSENRFKDGFERFIL